MYGCTVGCISATAATSPFCCFRAFCVLVLHVWLYSWLRKCNSCDITIFYCLRAGSADLALKGRILSRVQAPHTIYSRLAPFSVLSYQLAILAIILRL